MSGDTSDPDVAPDATTEGAAERASGERSRDDRDSLHVESVHVRRAPGFEVEDVRIEGLSPGITVLYGPNASGKTTTVNAIQWLLWPETAPEPADVVGHLSTDDHDWRIRVAGGDASYQRDGSDTAPPGLPPADQRERYRLALHDLLQHDADDADFAAAIERESAGGYDLGAAHDALGFGDSPGTRGLQVVTRTEDAVEHWHETEADLRDLAAERERLPDLDRKLADAREARRRVEVLDQTIEFARARDELATAEERLAAFPDQLAALTGDEAETVADLEAEIEEWADRRETAVAEREAAERELAAVGLPADGLPGGLLDSLQQRLDRLAALEQRADRAEADLEQAIARRSSAREDVPLDVDESALADADPEVWPDLSAFARTAHAVDAERRLQRTAHRWLGEWDRRDVDGSSGDQPEADRATLERGRQALEQWLATPPVDAGAGSGPEAGGTATVRIAAVATAVLGVAGAVLGAVVDPVLFGLVLVAGALLWYGLRAGRQGGAEDGGGADPRGAHRESYEQLGLDPPAAWTGPAVRERLTECYDALAAHELDRQRANTLETLVDDISRLDERERDLDERRERLRDHLGGAPEDTDHDLVATAAALRRWQERDADVRGHREELEAIRDRLDETLDDLAADLAPVGTPGSDEGTETDSGTGPDDVVDAATATAAVRDLEDRASRHAAALEDRDRAKRTVAEADEKLDDLRTERDAVFADAGLDPGDDDRLRELCDRVGAYDDAHEERDRAESVAEKERADLRDCPGYEPGLEERGVAELRAARQEAAATAADYDDLHERRTAIETRLEDAKQSAAVETARADADRALDDLEAQLADDCAAMVGDRLVEHVRDATVDANRPAVFRRARELLARITRGRYRLDLDPDATATEDGTPAFRAYDTVSERGFALDELSSGTQLQVLLSVRLAFVEYHEDGRRLPLLLDETLANSDDERARVIVDATIELARRGRQVLYCTARGEAVATWRDRLAGVDDVAYGEVDLAAVRGLDERVSVPDLDAVTQSGSVTSDAPPDPDAHDHDSYGEALDVAPFDPRLGAGRAHCWYLLEDVDGLAGLLEFGVERWGQVRTLLDQGLDDLVAADPAVRDRLVRRGDALETFVECWRRGRGERVTRETLEATDAVTETFIADVTDLARSVDGDASRILDSLRDGAVDRFRSDKADDLEAYFEANGYLDPVEPLDPDAVRVRTVAALVDAGLDRETAAAEADALLERLGRGERG